MAIGRVCLLGDAAFAVRPHAAAGTAKAAENAWTLAEAIEAFDGDLPSTLQMWSGHQTALGSSLIARRATSEKAHSSAATGGRAIRA
jgi:2,6-dihydroxypyridine 3-monooxygenase